MTLKSLSKLMFSFINELNIPVTETSIYLELEKHPEQYSMLAVTDVFNTFRINNGAYQVETGYLTQDICPFIAHVSRNDGEFVIVREISSESIRVSSEKSKREILTRTEFDSYFTGMILVADNESSFEESNYSAKKRSEFTNKLKMPFLIGSALLIFILYVFQNFEYLGSFALSVVCWELIKIGGLVVSILLILQNLDANNSLVKKLCSKGEKMDCNAILSSDAAKITDELSWSEVGLFYFCSSTLILMVYGNSLAVLQSLAIVNILCLPYTFYSIYYQSSVAKKWCVLCTVTQAILWFEFFVSVHWLFESLESPVSTEIVGMVILFLLPIVVWVFLKPFLKSTRQIAVLKQQLGSFKKNAELFNSMLVAQGRTEMPGKDFAIVLGSEEPKKIITIASHPTCSPCRKTHKILEKWLQADDDLQVRIVYALEGESTEGINYKAAQHISRLKLAKSDHLHEAVHQWYAQEVKDYSSWAPKFPVNIDRDAHDIMDQHINWCKGATIIQTPTIFINGFKLPDLFSIEDVRYLV